MKLYLVRGTEVEDANTDLLVVADNPDRAVDLWNDYCVLNSWPRRFNDEGEDSLPRLTTIEPEFLRVLLPEVEGTMYAGDERAIDWNNLPIVRR